MDGQLEAGDAAIPHPVSVGTAFVYVDEHDGRHMFFVASHATEPPDPQIVLMNFTTVRERSDRSCIAEAGEHPWIVHQSCVQYSATMLASVEELQRDIAGGDVLIQADLTLALLNKAWEGASISPHLSLKCKTVLKNQGWIAS